MNPPWTSNTDCGLLSGRPPSGLATASMPAMSATWRQPCFLSRSSQPDACCASGGRLARNAGSAPRPTVTYIEPATSDGRWRCGRPGRRSTAGRSPHDVLGRATPCSPHQTRRSTPHRPRGRGSTGPHHRGRLPRRTTPRRVRTRDRVGCRVHLRSSGDPGALGATRAENAVLAATTTAASRNLLARMPGDSGSTRPALRFGHYFISCHIQSYSANSVRSTPDSWASVLSMLFSTIVVIADRSGKSPASNRNGPATSERHVASR